RHDGSRARARASSSVWVLIVWRSAWSSELTRSYVATRRVSGVTARVIGLMVRMPLGDQPRAQILSGHERSRRACQQVAVAVVEGPVAGRPDTITRSRIRPRV